MGKRVVFYLDRGLIRQMSLTVMEIVTKILAAFGGSESRGEGIHKNVVTDLKALAPLCRIYPAPRLCL